MSLEFHPLISIASREPAVGRLLVDALSAYFVLPEGIWKTPMPLISGAQLIRVKVPDGEVENFYITGGVSGGVWFLLKQPGTDEHVFLRSKDGGATWQQLDDGLEVQDGGRKTRLKPTRMGVKGGAIFVNAGGGRNLLASKDDGKHWHLLSGSMGAQAAYPGKFLVRGREVVVGGEAPLDFAYLEKGELNFNTTGWARPLKSVAPADIGNRNVQFIEENPYDSAMFAGVEGGLMKSTDGGNSWQWVQRFEQGDVKYPYIQCVLFSSGREIWAGGFDKPNDSAPYLSRSQDSGQNWTDVSSIFAVNKDWRDLLAIQTGSTGQLLAAVVDSKRMSVEIGELVSAKTLNLKTG